jgi:hypothetical protein
MGATYVGVRRAHPYSWLLSSPQQPLETEDPPTVSLAPQYTSQRLCRARLFLETIIACEVYLVKNKNVFEAQILACMRKPNTV